MPNRQDMREGDELYFEEEEVEEHGDRVPGLWLRG